jgi:DNA-binding response OmpR family regulator
MNDLKRISIAVVENYAAQREELELLLRLEGFEVFGADSGQSLDRLLLMTSIDVIMLDLNLPGEDGLSIAARLRKSCPETRIIMLTGRVRGIDKVEGYESGADVYLTKPQRPREILAVIRSLTRRMGFVEASPQTPVWILSPIELSITSPRGEVITLSHRDLELFKRFHLAPKQYLDFFALLEHFELPPTPEGKSQVVRIISRLRLKIQPHTSGAPCIKADRKDGYQLCLNLKIV